MPRRAGSPGRHERSAGEDTAGRGWLARTGWLRPTMGGARGRKLVRPLVGGALLLALSLLLMACYGSPDPQDTIDVRSDFNQKIFDLYALVFWLATAVFIIVEAALVYSVIRFRRRPGDPLPAQVHGNNKLEVAWTIAPALLLAFVAVPTLQTIANTSKVPAPGPDVQEVRIIGHQWWWEVRYPDPSNRDDPAKDLVVTANEIHIPADKTASFILTSADTQHSFWIPKMGGKQDILPTRTNHLHFKPQETGEFYGQCAELCGSSHANMRMRLFVQTQADFDAWMQQQRQQPGDPASDQIRKGRSAFLRSQCVACHSIAGTTAQGVVAPNLTHVGSRTTIAGAVLENTPDNMKRWIEDPQQFKPGHREGYTMPPFQDVLKPEDIDNNVAYLQSLK
jgi:cytochrome c oxidase subunit 2